MIYNNKFNSTKYKFVKNSYLKGFLKYIYIFKLDVEHYKNELIILDSNSTQIQGINS